MQSLINVRDWSYCSVPCRNVIHLLRFPIRDLLTLMGVCDMQLLEYNAKITMLNARHTGLEEVMIRLSKTSTYPFDFNLLNGWICLHGVLD